MSLSNRGSSHRTVLLVCLEAFLIVLGVALAYGSTAWYESKKENEAADVALMSILEELEENRSSVLASIEYHATLRDALVGAVRAGVAPNRAAFPQGYVMPAEMLTTAWDLAHARGAIAALPYQEVLALSRVYFDQESYQSSSQEVGGLIYGSIFEGGGDSILERYPNLLEIVMTFSYRECQLLVGYATVLPSLDPASGGDIESSCRAMLNR